MQGKRPVLLLALGMLLIVMIFTLPFLSGSRIPFQGDVINSDVTEFHFPVKTLYGSYLKKGSLPIWLPHVGCGFPLIAEGQSGLLYPLNLALFRLLSPVIAYNLALVLSLAMSLIFSYLLFRSYGLSRFTSLFSSTAFTFSGYTMAKLKFSYMINSLCWIPLAVLGLEKSFQKGNFAYLFLTTLALAMQILAGGPQIFMITTSLVVFVFAWRFASHFVTQARAPQGPSVAWSRRRLIIPLLSLLMCLLLALAFAAPQLLPMLKGYPLSNRAMNQSFDFTLGVNMQPRNLVMFFSPYQFGNPARNTYQLKNDYFWENVAYPGLLTMVLALIALLFFCRKDTTMLMWTGAGLLALLISLGSYTPLAEFMWRYVPGFRFFRFWQRFLVIVVLALAVLAGRGLEGLLGRLKGKGPWRPAVAVLCLAILLVDLGLFSYQQVSTIDAKRILEETAVSSWLRDATRENGEENMWRMEMIGEEYLWKEVMRQSGGWLGNKELFFEYLHFLPPNHNLVHDLSCFSQYGDYGIYRFKLLDSISHYFYVVKGGWKGELTQTAVNILSLYSTPYLLTPLELSQDGLHEIARYETGIRGVTLRVYEVENAVPLVRMVQDYQVVETGERLDYPQILEAFWDGQSARERVILETNPTFQYGPGPAGSAEITSMSDRRIEISANTPGGGILVYSGTYFPEWHVYVDGREGELLRVNYAAMGVELQPGTHKVEFVYRATSFLSGFPLSGAALLLALLICYRNRKKRFLLIRP